MKANMKTNSFVHSRRAPFVSIFSLSLHRIFRLASMVVTMQLCWNQMMMVLADFRQFPLLDAMIAAGAASPAPSPSFTLEEMKSVLPCAVMEKDSDIVLPHDCTQEKGNKNDEGNNSDIFSLIEQNIKEIIDLALPLAQMPAYRSRFMEYASEIFSVGDNYAHEQRSVTMVCVALNSLPGDGPEGDEVAFPAAYAGHLFSHLDHGKFPPQDIFQDSNVSVILEADIMELPVSGAIFVPKQYCLDLDVIASEEASSSLSARNNTQEADPDTLSSVSSQLPERAPAQMAQTLSKASIPFHDSSERARIVSLGTKAESSTSFLNRFSWVSNLWVNKTDKQFIEDAYETPKVELIGILGVWRVEGDGYCDDYTAENTATENITCLLSAARSYMEERKLDSDPDALTFVPFQLGMLYLKLLDWKDKHPRFAEALSVEGIPPELQKGYEHLLWNGTSTKDIATYLFPTPPLYEVTATDEYKLGLSGIYRLPEVLQANPFIPADLAQNLTFAAEFMTLEEKEELVRCHGKQESSSKALGATLFFNGALKRRLYERGLDICIQDSTSQALPLSDVSQWFIAEVKGLSEVKQLNRDYLNQNVEWTKRPDGLYELAKGNLTEKILGRTQNKLFVTDFANPTTLKRLLTAQLSSTIYSRAGTKATHPDHPCRKAVDNWEIFLFVLTIIVAACGGVNAVLQSVHYACHWWGMISPCYKCCRPSEDHAKSSSATDVVPGSAANANADGGTTPANSSNPGGAHSRGTYTEDASRTANGSENRTDFESGVEWRSPASNTAATGCAAGCCGCYDVFLIFLGIAAFFGLYVPLIVQIKDEFDVHQFQTNVVDMEAQYTDINEAVVPVALGGWGTLTTFVHSRTFCEEARPWHLVGLLVAGVFAAAIINAPYIHRACQTLAFRCCRKRIAYRIQQHSHSQDTSLFQPASTFQSLSNSSACQKNSKSDVELNPLCTGTPRFLSPVTVEDRYLILKRTNGNFSGAHNQASTGVPVLSTLNNSTEDSHTLSSQQSQGRRLRRSLSLA